MSNTDTTKNGVNSGDRERQAASASYKTLAMLLISTVKSSNSHGSDKGKKTSTWNSKISIVIWDLDIS
jgi:hypothetical protein